MSVDSKYLTPADYAAITDFCNYLAKRFFSTPAGPLYHYTTGENLIRIVEGGQLWATQAACLNDTTELVYAVGQLRSRLKALRAATHNAQLDPLLARLDERMTEPRADVASAFVTCFSERNDDLSQWRSYSGGEGGYAIHFDSARLLGSKPPAPRLVRVEYDEAIHAAMFDDVLKWSGEFFLKCEGAKAAPSVDAWVEDFSDYWLWTLSFFAPFFKHPKFEAEKEWRLVYHLHPDDPPKMKFTQRQSMMRHHLPLPLPGRLPIVGITVGPCRHPELSVVAASDLLKAHGYDPNVVRVDRSKVPYRSA